MTPIALIPASDLIAQLAVPASRAIALSAAVGLALAAFRVKSTSFRLFAWTGVLYAAIAMPALQWLLPALPIRQPAIFEQAFQHYVVAERVVKVAHVSALTPSEPQPARSLPARNEPSSVAEAAPGVELPQQRPIRTKSFWSSLSSGPLASAIYPVVTAIFFLRFFIGLAFARRLVQASQPIDHARLRASLVFHARSAGLTSLPVISESECISVPLTIGAFHPAILLPSEWRDWTGAKLDAVLAHELSHVARRDALTQRLCLVHRAIFWFSPLAWWLERHLATLAEQASDEAALTCGADRKDYARTLLGFFEALQTAPRRVWWQGVAMAKPGEAEKRVERILSFKGAVNVRMKKSIAAAFLTMAVPVIYLAASVHPASANQESGQTQSQSTAKPSAGTQGASDPAVQSEPATETGNPEEKDELLPGGPIAPALPAAPHGGVTGGIHGPAPAAPPALAPMAPVGPVGIVAQVAPVAPTAPATPVAPIGRAGFSYRYDFDEDLRFVIVSGKTDSFTMSGSSQDAHHVEKLRKTIDGDFIWFQEDEKSYVIRDQATIDRALKLWEPQKELGKKQEALGKQQEALGKQQEELGAKMEAIRVQVPDMTEELEKLKAELKALNGGATADQIGRIQSEIGELQSKIGNVQSHAGDQQSKIGEEMSVLGEKQGELGRQQGELGRQQGELSRDSNKKMKELLDEAISKGTAQPEL